MKCINDELIQKYIDGETDSQETVRIEKHLADCSPCAQNLAERKAFADAIKTKIGQWGRQPVIVPGFVAPVFRKHRLKLKVRHYVYAVSAACAVLLFVFLRPEQSEDDLNTTVHLMYSFDGDFNSNRPISQQEMTIKVMGADGNIVN